jgi:hypothetical protein
LSSSARYRPGFATVFDGDFIAEIFKLKILCNENCQNVRQKNKRIWPFVQHSSADDSDDDELSLRGAIGRRGGGGRRPVVDIEK